MKTIEVEDLYFTYPNNQESTISGINFSVSKGEIYGFLGPSGAGKSTTQKLLYKILHGYKGKIIIEGKSLDKWGKSYLEKIGVGFELPNHYLKLSGIENLKMFSSFYPKKKLLNLDELFDLVGLADSKNILVEKYSKGMKMRLNFIRSIMHDPDVLFFDEPTAGLDPLNAVIIKQKIKDLKNKGKTIFITTHNMNSADELCDQVSFIVNGKLIVTDAPSHLKEVHGKETLKLTTMDGHEIDYPVKGLGSNQAFLEKIKTSEVKSIHTLEASLEEVFVKLTGKALKNG